MASSKALARTDDQQDTQSPRESSEQSPRSRLIGWLVSYADDSRGAAHEIRSGRSFISSDELPNTRIITIAERDISSPHLALNASPRHRVMVQDIFSESGSYLIRGRSGDEIAVRGPTEIEHGDWIRVGAHTRFQVCLIDGQAAALQKSRTAVK